VQPKKMTEKIIAHKNKEKQRKMEDQDIESIIEDMGKECTKDLIRSNNRIKYIED
jgi:hypothetical protein